MRPSAKLLSIHDDSDRPLDPLDELCEITGFRREDLVKLGARGHHSLRGYTKLPIDRAVTFPMIDHHGDIVSYKARRADRRAIEVDIDHYVKSICQPGRPVGIMTNFVDTIPPNRPVVITEGEMDMCAVMRACDGVVVIGLPGAGAPDRVLAILGKKLKDCNNPIFMTVDPDDAGTRLANSLLGLIPGIRAIGPDPIGDIERRLAKEADPATAMEEWMREAKVWTHVDVADAPTQPPSGPWHQQVVRHGARRLDLSAHGIREIRSQEDEDGNSFDVYSPLTSFCIRMAERIVNAKGEYAGARMEIRAGERVVMMDVEPAQWTDSRLMAHKIDDALCGGIMVDHGGWAAIYATVASMLATYPPRIVKVVEEGLSKDHVLRYQGLTITSGVEAYLSGGTPYWVVPGADDEIRAKRSEHNYVLTSPSSQDQLRSNARVIVENWCSLFSSPEGGLITLALGIMGPLLPSLVNCPNLCLALTGMTGSGKTTTARELSGIWGCKDAAGQHSTPLASLEAARQHRHRLCFLDDFRSAEKLEVFVSLVFDRGARRALKRSGEFREMGPPADTLVLLTGESLEGGGQSTRNRILEINFPPNVSPDSYREPLNKLQRVDTTIVLTALLSYLLGQEVDALKSMYDEYRSTAASMGIATTRGTEFAATALLAVTLTRRAFELVLGEKCLLVEDHDVLRTVLERHRESEIVATPGEVFIKALNEELCSGGRLIAIDAVWRGDGHTSLQELRQSDREKPHGGTMRVWRIYDPGQVKALQDGSCSVELGPYVLACPIRKTIRSLDLKLDEWAVGASLRAMGRLESTSGTHNSTAYRVYDYFGREVGRSKLTTIRFEGQGDTK